MGWLFFVFFPSSSACFGVSELSCQLEVQQVGKGQHLHLSGWVDSAALVFCSQSRRHPASVPCASCRSCCQWQWTSRSSPPRRCGETKKAQGLVFNKQPRVQRGNRDVRATASIRNKSLFSRSHNIMIYLSPYFPCVVNIDVDCGQPQACVKVLHLWSPNTLLIDLQGSFQQTAPLGAASRDSTAGCWSLFNGPHSRTTVPLPEHLLQQLPQSAADFFGEASRWSSRQTCAHTSSDLSKHNIGAYLTLRFLINK